MTPSLLLTLLLPLAVPALAKPHNGTYPTPCSDLWPAVTNTLGNAGNYKIIAADSDNMKASFVVVGALYPAINAVFLNPKNNGCALKVHMGFTGNDDEGAFRNRVDHAFSKLRAAQPALPAKSSGAD